MCIEKYIKNGDFMIKKNIKILLTTTILSTQLSVNSFAMGPDEDQSRTVISSRTSYGNGGWIDSGIDSEEELNPEETRQEKMKLLETLRKDIQICERVLRTGKAEFPYKSFVRDLVQYDLTRHNKHVERLMEKLEELGGENVPISDYIEEPEFDFSPIDMGKEERDYQRGINRNLFKADYPSSSSDED